MDNPKNVLPPTQKAAFERLSREGKINWSATTTTEAKALNALVEKGIAKKVTSGGSCYYEKL